MNLKKLLILLHEGKEVALNERENQNGEMVVVDSVYHIDGAWMRSQLNCWSSHYLGFGTCGCVSHPPFRSERITRKELLSHLRTLLRKEAEDKVARLTEITWLEEQLKAL